MTSNILAVKPQNKAIKTNVLMFSHINLIFYSLTRSIWQYGLWGFQTGSTKLERFLPKDQHTQRKLSNFENWSNGEVSKSAKSPNFLTFKVNLLYQKLSESFSIFFFIEEYQFRSTSFVIDIF